MRKSTVLYDLINSNGNLGELILVLGPLKRAPLKEWLLKACISMQSGISARIPEPDKLITISLILGLIEIKKPRKNNILILSDAGKRLLRFKTIEKDRFTKQQGRFIFSIAIARLDILKDILLVINMLNTSPNGNLWISSNDKRIDYIEDQILRFFQQLKIAKYAEGNIVFEKDDKEWLVALVSSKFNIDIDNLLDLLQLKRKYGIIAEDFVLQKERERLINGGQRQLAKLVKKISDQNVAAGYDISSFNGIGSSFIPDRFIEVKGTSNNNLTFYISKNEVEIAKKLQNEYWIYCVLNVTNSKARRTEIINNPYKIIFKEKKLTAEPVLWRICKENEDKKYANR